MITDAFDAVSPAKIYPDLDPNAPAVDACIVTFSYKIERFVTENYNCTALGRFMFATGPTPVYGIEYGGKKFAFYKTYVGAPRLRGDGGGYARRGPYR